jgi:hypothetical protein
MWQWVESKRHVTTLGMTFPIWLRVVVPLMSTLDEKKNLTIKGSGNDQVKRRNKPHSHILYHKFIDMCLIAI